MKGWVIKRFPALLFLLAGTGLITALVLTLLDTGQPVYPMAPVMLAGYLGWIALEIRVTFRTASSSASADDHGSEQLYGITRMVMIFAAMFGPVPWTGWSPWLVLPPLLFVAGVALRLSAIRSLGRFYSHRVRVIDGHQIVTTGPYRLLRHPSYSGMLLANAGLVCYFANPVSVAAFVVLFVPAVVNRILVEERVMTTITGYAEFAAHRKRVAPFVW